MKNWKLYAGLILTFAGLGLATVCFPYNLSLSLIGGGLLGSYFADKF